MKKDLITKYLAKEMGWLIISDELAARKLPWVRVEMDVEDFDPFTRIEHAFMVVEWMAKQKFYVSIIHDPFAVSLLWWKVAISGWEQSKDTEERGQDPAYLITLAAFKALAPAALQERLL